MEDPLFASLGAFPRLVCGLSARQHGTMTAAADPARKAQVIQNFQRYFASIDLAAANAVRCKQAHGATVAAVAAAQRGTAVRDTDGLVTATPQTFLAVTVGDCLPLYFYDPKRQAVGLAHAGWRSLQQGIPAATVRQLQDQYGTSPSDVLVGIGPGIGPCHFLVGPDVAERFAAFPAAFTRRADGTLALDLKAVAALQLHACGVRREHIETSSDCTACLSERYFSYRRDRPAVVEAMVAVIGLR
ncbi:MAG: peptidoglycan editing factor PgeF [bacterium]|nr:peptidoglycan editing factor PgeF [bacterium]